MNLQEMLDKRNKALMDMRAMLDAAQVENRDLSGEESNRYAVLETEYTKHDTELRRLERLEARERELREMNPALVRENLGGQEERTAPAHGTEEYRNKFFGFVRNGDLSVRSLNTASASQGGVLVPTELEKKIIQSLDDVTVLRQIGNVITLSTAADVPVEDSVGEAYWTGEEAEYAESDAQFSMKKLKAHKLTALIKVSEELLMDSAFDLESYIGQAFGRRFNISEEKAFVSGKTANQPNGLLNGIDSVTTAGVGSISMDDIKKLFFNVSSQYRTRASWLLSDNAGYLLSVLKGADGQYLWQPSLQAGVPDLLHGKPVFYSPGMPSGATGEIPIAFGDFSYYWIADRSGIFVQRLVEKYSEHGQVGFRAFRRVDGQLMLNAAVKGLKIK